MISGKHLSPKCSASVLAPCFYFLSWNHLVLETAERPKRTFQWWTRNVLVSLRSLKVCANDRHHKLHQIRVVENFSRRPLQTSQLGDELQLRQVVGGFVNHSHVRSGTTGDEQLKRLRLFFLLQATHELVAHERAHAMTEEGKRLLQKWLQIRINRIHNRYNIVAQRF